MHKGEFEVFQNSDKTLGGVFALDEGVILCEKFNFAVAVIERFNDQRACLGGSHIGDHLRAGVYSLSRLLVSELNRFPLFFLHLNNNTFQNLTIQIGIKFNIRKNEKFKAALRT